MVMHARKPARVSDGCNDRRDPQSYQTHKSQPKIQSGTLHRNDKVRDGSSDATPPCKMLRRSDESPVSRQGDVSGHGKAKISHTPRGKNGTNGSPQENSHNSTHHNSDSHGGPGRPADRRQEPADDWTEHISSSGKKYYYNCRTEVSQWEKPKDLLEREQRQKDTAKMAANSFPRDMDYRQEALQDKATAKSTSSGDPSTAPNSSHSSSTSSSTSSSASQSVNSAPGGPPGSTAASSSSSSSSSVAATSSNPSPAAQAAAPAQAATAAVQSQSSALLQDPALLHQLLPALQAALQMNNGSMDVAKINEVLAAAVTQASLRSMLHKLLTAGPSAFNITALLSQAAQQSGQAAAQQPSQSPASLTSDASSPRPYGSPRNGTQQASQLSQKAQAGAGAPPSGTGTSQARGNASLGKPVLLSQVSVEKRPEDPRTLQQRSSMEMPSPGPNHTPGAAGPPLSSSSSSSGGSTGQGPASGGHCSFTPSLATHFDENLIRHVQGWPAEHVEKQAARLREDVFNMGSLYMSEICTELKNLRSLVRVCEIQATLREQRILFLRQQSKELDKLKNQNSYMA